MVTGGLNNLSTFFCSPLNETPENGSCWLNGLLPNDSNLYL